MPNSVCLYGPAFSILGDTRFTGQDVNFQVIFDDQSGADALRYTEWYLDDTLVTGQSVANFAAKISCGAHTIGARILSQEGWSGIKALSFKTCMVPVSLYISGTGGLNEGTNAYFYVLQSYTDGSTDNLTGQYTFTSTTGGSFNGNLFTAAVDDNSYDPSTLTITAVKDGIGAITKDVTIYNTTPIVLTSLDLTGPDSIAEGSSAEYHVIASYSNHTQEDQTNNYVLSATEGSFTGGILHVAMNTVTGDTRTVTLNATKNGINAVSKQITVIDKTVKAGILVVDLFSNPELDAIGFINNSEVGVSHVAAFSGNNIIIAGSAAKDAYILASDYNPSTSTNWRFEFNLAKLVADYPGTQSFNLVVKGRSSVAGTLTGAFSARTNDAVMTMQNASGSYMPSITGGSNTVPLTGFSSAIAGGANNSYAENDLTTIISFVYDVPSDMITYTTRDQPIVISDFDYMAVRYHWLEGSGSDLDILVGYENNATSEDNLYVGFGQPSATIPVTAATADSYLWWGTDSTSTTGYEGVLIGIKKFIAAYPASPDIVEIALYAVWWGTPVSGDFTVELVTYKGGTMSLAGTDFVNAGGVQASSNTVSVNTLLKSQGKSPSTSYKVGVVRYSKATNSAVIVINPGV